MAAGDEKTRKSISNLTNAAVKCFQEQLDFRVDSVAYCKKRGSDKKTFTYH